MSTSVTFQGTTYSIPSEGEVDWADTLSAFLEALAAYNPSITLSIAGSAALAGLRLVPQASAPTGPNAVGALYMTSAGVLKVCTVAGSPGTFVSVGAQT